MEGKKYWDLGHAHLLPSTFCQSGLLSALSCDGSEEIQTEDLRAKNGGQKMLGPLACSCFALHLLPNRIAVRTVV